MSDSPASERPVFRGLTWHRTPHFSFLHPIDWHRFEWLDDREGVLFGPNPENNQTLFAVDVKDLGIEINRDDIEDLEAGFLSAIDELPERQIETQEHWVAGVLIGLEAKYTYQEDGMTRKRWVRVLYQDSRQITVMAQGATAEEYDYWLPMFFEQMMTFRVHTGYDDPSNRLEL